jgi:hypothetical protein
MDQDLHNRLYKFLKQELADRELNSLVLKQLNNKTYKISTYRLTKDTSTVESSTGQIYQFVSLTPAVVYCCLMAINYVNDAQIILTLNDELARLNEKTQTTRKRLRRVSNSFDRDLLVAKLLQFETQYDGKVSQMKKNIVRAKYIIKPGQSNGS